MKLLIYCAGGFGREVCDVARRINHVKSQWDEIVFIDNYLGKKEHYGTKVYTFNDVLNLNIEMEFIIANGEPCERQEIFEQIKSQGYNFTKIIDPTAIISDYSTIGEGSIILSNSLISSEVKIRENVVVQPNCVIGHNISIGKHSVISAGFLPAGKTEIGDRVFIGMGVITQEKIKIGNDSIVGMGSVVYNNIDEGVVALGNPARIARKNESKKVFK